MIFGRSRAREARADGSSPPRLSRDAYVLGVVAFFVMVGFGVVVPVLPVYARSFGVGYLQVGAIISAFALMRFVASPFVGRLIDLAGERTILTVGIGIVAISSALSGFAQDYLHLLLMRGIGGIGSAMFSVSAMTLLLGSTAPTLRARSVGFYQGGFLIGGMAGPAIGGLLAAISLRAPFFFYAGTLAIAGLVGAIMLRSTRVGSEAEVAAAVASRTPFRTVIRDPRFQVASLANFATGWTSFGVRGALVPLLIVEVLRQPSFWTGIAFAAAAVVQAIAIAPAAKFVDTVGRRPAIIGAYLAAGVVIICVPFAPNVAMLTAFLCLYGIAAAFMGTAPAAAVGDAAGAGGGRPVAVFSMFSDFGAIVGPLAAGFLADTVSYPVAFMVGAALLFATAAFALRMPRGVPSSAT